MDPVKVFLSGKCRLTADHDVGTGAVAYTLTVHPTAAPPVIQRLSAMLSLANTPIELHFVSSQLSMFPAPHDQREEA